jgi:uncharacterized damage-inducible protein DinB
MLSKSEGEESITMNAYGAKDLARSFRTVRKNTIQIAEEIPEDKYSFKPADACRTIAETLAHIAATPNWGYEMHKSGVTELNFDNFAEDWAKFQAAQKALQTKSQILKALREDGEKYAAWLETLSDKFLAEQIKFPAPVDPPAKTRFEMLLGTKEHEMHHRGQLMVAQRMIGLVPHLTRKMEADMANMQKPQTQTSKA